MKRVLDRRDEVVCGLPPDHLAVRLSRAAQHNPKQPRSTRLSVHDDRSRDPEVDLSFLAGCRLHATHGHGSLLTQPMHEPHHGVIAARKANRPPGPDESAASTDRRPASPESFPVLLAQALRPAGRWRLRRNRLTGTTRPGVRVWPVFVRSRLAARGPGVRPRRFLSLQSPHILVHRPPVHAQQTGDLRFECPDAYRVSIE